MAEVNLMKGWPPLGPKAYAVRLGDGYALTPNELLQLKKDAEAARRLEQEDPAFARASRRYRHLDAEEAHVEELRRKLEAKAQATEHVRERMRRERGMSRMQRDRVRERGQRTRQEVTLERERQRQKLVERIALAERRTLVRETIQKALVSQSRSEGHAERIMFTHPSKLSDAPGPGAYATPRHEAKGTSFAVHPSVEIRKTEDPRPGPGAYDPGVRPQVGGGPSISFGAHPVAGKRAVVEAPVQPGPGAYQVTSPTRKGGTISRHVVKSNVERDMERAAQQPGPGAYEPNALTRGKSSTMTGRTRGMGDVHIAASARRPGPGSYNLPAGRVRGGVMTLNRHDVKLPGIAEPGPGSYMQTPTIDQEREMRKLSKQVVDLVRQRQVLNAPDGHGGRRARARTGTSMRGLTQAYADSGSIRANDSLVGSGGVAIERPEFRQGLSTATVLE
uniref:Uncharacterized protein n=1 Tax=Haptolina brevifila TaxID=156173 RepID=A0A7S2JEG2_9EUKA|mmetsp:Transcript_81089/g.161207  ORF Transcript_81089/g.161207 Transcript_81089/m.161207 type:complete len:448 (+) Transcript_81089:73-1416(+)